MLYDYQKDEVLLREQGILDAVVLRWQEPSHTHQWHCLKDYLSYEGDESDLSLTKSKLKHLVG